MTRPIIITDHAAKRLLQRMGVKPDKHWKVANKAFNTEGYRRGPGDVLLKDFLGFTFVFDDKQRHLILVSVVNPREEPVEGKHVYNWNRLNTSPY